jgi:hypothetical protein
MPSERGAACFQLPLPSPQSFKRQEFFTSDSVSLSDPLTVRRFMENLKLRTVAWILPPGRETSFSSFQICHPCSQGDKEKRNRVPNLCQGNRSHSQNLSLNMSLLISAISVTSFSSSSWSSSSSLSGRKRQRRGNRRQKESQFLTVLSFISGN